MNFLKSRRCFQRAEGYSELPGLSDSRWISTIDLSLNKVSARGRNPRSGTQAGFSSSLFGICQQMKADFLAAFLLLLGAGIPAFRSPIETSGRVR
jgi:hypothetical protein